MRWIHDGRLPAIRISERVYRIPVPALDRFLTGRPILRPTIEHRYVDELPEFGEDEELIEEPPSVREPPGFPL
jgi:hypothetical protein